MNQLKISSVFLFTNIFFTIYNGNYILLITEIPVATTSVLYHHNLVKDIRVTDILCAHYAFWFHMYFANIYSNTAIYLYILCPILYIFSLIYKENKDIAYIFHAGVHYMLTIGTIFLNSEMRIV